MYVLVSVNLRACVCVYFGIYLLWMLLSGVIICLWEDGRFMKEYSLLVSFLPIILRIWYGYETWKHGRWLNPFHLRTRRPILILATGEKWLKQIIYDKIVNGIIEKEKNSSKIEWIHRGSLPNCIPTIKKIMEKKLKLSRK